MTTHRRRIVPGRSVTAGRVRVVGLAGLVLVLMMLTGWAVWGVVVAPSSIPEAGSSGSSDASEISHGDGAGGAAAQARSGSSSRSASAVSSPAVGECASAARACVDLSTGQAWLQQDGKVAYGPVRTMPGTQTGAASVGPDSSATPLGRFHVLRKKKDEYSMENHEEMPYAVYFASGGIAFHEGSVDDPSHGCLHLSHTSAARFFHQLQVGDEVHVFASGLRPDTSGTR